MALVGWLVRRRLWNPCWMLKFSISFKKSFCFWSVIHLGSIDFSTHPRYCLWSGFCPLDGEFECLKLSEEASGSHSFGPTASSNSLRYSGSPHSWETTLTGDNFNQLRGSSGFLANNTFKKVGNPPTILNSNSIVFTHMCSGSGKFAFFAP